MRKFMCETQVNNLFYSIIEPLHGHKSFGSSAMLKNSPPCGCQERRYADARLTSIMSIVKATGQTDDRRIAAQKPKLQATGRLRISQRHWLWWHGDGVSCPTVIHAAYCRAEGAAAPVLAGRYVLAAFSP